MALAPFVALVNSSTPSVAVTVPVPSKSVVVVVPVVTVPKPVRLAPASIVRPAVSVSEPPSILMVPLVTLWSAPIVSAPLLPISSVWLAEAMLIALSDVAVLSNFRLDVTVEFIAATSPAPTSRSGRGCRPTR